MPIFRYSCGDCATAFETLVRKNDPVVQCPQCTSKNLNQLLTAPTIASGKYNSSEPEPCTNCPSAGMCSAG